MHPLRHSLPATAFLLGSIAFLSCGGGGGGGGGKSNAERLKDGLDVVFTKSFLFGIRRECECEEQIGRITDADQCYEQYESQLDGPVDFSEIGECEAKIINGPGGEGYVDCFLIIFPNLMDKEFQCLAEYTPEDICEDIPDAIIDGCLNQATEQLSLEYGYNPEEDPVAFFRAACPDFGEAEIAVSKALNNCDESDIQLRLSRMGLKR